MDSLPVTDGNLALEGRLLGGRDVHFGGYHEMENSGWKAAISVNRVSDGERTLSATKLFWFLSRNAPFDGEVLLAFNKPYGVLSQCTPDGSPNRPLAEFRFPSRVYSLGRLDADSEGLLLLSDEGALNHRLLNPAHGHPRTYWVQVERIPTDDALRQLQDGLQMGEYQARKLRAWRLDPAPEVPPRIPPIRFRKTVPDCWIGLELHEGKNRQVRRMTAAIGHPTLRLLRVAIGGLTLGTLSPGEWRELNTRERGLVLDR